MKGGWVYILRCSDGSLYTGSTSNLERRLAEHHDGTDCGYTAARRPCSLLFPEGFSAMTDAIRAERQIKRWSRAKKFALAAGDYDLLHRLSQCRNPTHHRENPGHGKP